MSSIKTTQLHELTPEKLIGSFSEYELVGLILRLKDTVLSQRSDLARLDRQYNEKKMQYEAVRDRLERVASSGDEQEDQPAGPRTVTGWGVGEDYLDAIHNFYIVKDTAKAVHNRGTGNLSIYRIDVTEVEPEQWWLVEYNMRDQVFVYTAPSMIPPPGEILYMDSTIDRLMWRNTARDMDDAREKAVAAWKQAFGVEVEL